MSPGPEKPGTLRFGVFEADLLTGELRKRGRRLKLQDQPFRVLALLLSRPGELVTREELQTALWPADTFVEFEQGVNTAIKKLRQALGDSADNPRFIETLPRKGYRFIAPVGPPATPVPATGPTPAPSKRRARAVKPALWIGLAGLAACVAVGWWLNRRTSPRRGSQTDYRMVQVTRDPTFTGFPAVSADGRLLAYASDRAGGGNVDLWVQQLDGGSAVRLTDHEASDFWPAFSPDGSRIAFVSLRDGGGIFVMPALGGQARLLAKEGLRPRFSPDGRLIAYTVGVQGSFEGSRIYVIPSGGGLPRQLFSEFTGAALPVWTPDGKHLAFLGRHPKEGFDIWVGSFDGRAVRTGTEDVLHKQQRVGLASLEAWDASSSSLLLTGASGDSANVWRLPVSPATWKVKGPAQRLTFGVGESNACVASRGRIVFSSITAQRDVWSLPLAANHGTALGRLERLTTGGASGCDISGNGRFLVFRSQRSGGMQICIRDLLTLKEVALTDNPEPKGMPKIASDGSKVGFSQLDREGPATYVVGSRGGPAERVCVDCGGPTSWSPDGNRFLQHHPAGGRSRIYLTDTATRQRRLVAEHDQLPLYVARFAADGRWIAFKGDIDSRRTVIFIAPLHERTPSPTKEWIPVTESSAWDDLPRWSPDGRLLYFVSDRDGYRCIWARRLNATTRQPEGRPFAVQHFHELQLSLSALALSELELALAGNRLVFPLAEVRSNIWIMEPLQP